MMEELGIGKQRKGTERKGAVLILAPLFDENISASVSIKTFELCESHMVWCDVWHVVCDAHRCGHAEHRP